MIFKTIKIIFIVVFSVILLTMFAGFLDTTFSQTFYVKSNKGKIYDNPSLKGKEIAVGSRGKQVIFIESKGSWYKVEIDNIEGWILKFILSRKMVKTKLSVLNKKVDIRSQARKRASVFTSAASARGLAGSNLDLEYREDFDELKEIEKNQVDEQEGLIFIMK